MSTFIFRSLFITVAVLVSIAESTVYSGRVVDGGNPAVPVANATISLKGTETYSDTAGRFSLTTETAVFEKQPVGRSSGITFSNGIIFFSCDRRQTVRAELFSLAGRRVFTLFNTAYEAGEHRVALPDLLRRKTGNGAFIALFEKGGTRFRVKVFSTNLHSSTIGAGAGLHGILRNARTKGVNAATDSLMVSRKGFVSTAVAAIAADVGDVVLMRDPREIEIDRKADSIIALMTIEEKAGQMCQAQINFTNTYARRLKDADVAAKGIGSVFNGGSDQSAIGKGNTPTAWAAAIDRVQTAVLTSSRLKIPVIYGQDCVHGIAELDSATVFPHNIGLGCTHDSALVAKVGRITAAECAGVGVRLNFAPCISAVRNERWGRTYEGFGETPEINTLMGVAYIRGLQGDGDLSKVNAIAACTKHLVGDGGTDNGINNGKATISEATMRAVHLPPYAACAREQMATVMPSYHSWTRNGKDWIQTIDPLTVTSMLKKELGFDGFCVSDWDAVLAACGAYNEACVAQAVNAGLDMAMIVGDTNCTNFIQSVVSGVNNATIPISRVDDAVKRILRIKFRLGLFDHPFSDADLRAKIGSVENRAVARECVRKSLVLLKNDDNVLPLKKTENIVVVGPYANNLGAQCGGWTISWQGSISPSGYRGIAGQTILDGLKSLGTNVTFDEKGADLVNADKIVVVVGEKPYAEGSGDVTVPDLSSNSLCPNNGLIQTCFNSGKPVILVLLSGRPMIIDTELPWCKAIIAAWLPGSEGGGIADVLFGDYNFTGTLTHTWPVSANQIPINAGPVYGDEQHGGGGAPLFPYGFSLKYNQ
ncbi:MAG: glycoside hydrolase family 3 C-terminal domain-containing protein [Chitinispirillaceae bacterium]|nr:glycoside hydrolase family 3 C-terminal domain-containing protein [Chitinispirillaceae bacterium]